MSPVQATTRVTTRRNRPDEVGGERHPHHTVSVHEGAPRDRPPNPCDAPSARTLRQRVIGFVEEFHWIHTSLGLIGNGSFFVGSVFFLWEATKPAGVWLFIVDGSSNP